MNYMMRLFSREVVKIITVERSFSTAYRRRFPQLKEPPYKRRQKTGGTQHAAFEHCLQFVEQVGNRPAVLHQDLVRGPTRKQISSKRVRALGKQAKLQAKATARLCRFEERDELKIAMATRLLQNRRNVAGLLRIPNSSRNSFIRNDRTFPAANFNLLPSGIVEEKCVVAGTVIGRQIPDLPDFSARFAHQFRDSINFFTRVGPDATRVPFGR